VCEGLMFESGSRCCWRHASPANSMDGFKSHTLHQMNGDVAQMDQERSGPNEDIVVRVLPSLLVG
jgi:hypothetical protein